MDSAGENRVELALEGALDEGYIKVVLKLTQDWS
jgi:hypothetical protein